MGDGATGWAFLGSLFLFSPVPLARYRCGCHFGGQAMGWDGMAWHGKAWMGS